MRGILVTGMSRSGTTWIGKMLAARRELAYLHEPTNVDCAWQAWNVGLPHQFMYLTDADSDRYQARFERLLDLRPNWRSLALTKGHPARIRSTLEQVAFLRNARKEGRSPLIKDPLAVFASQWLAGRFDVGVVVAVRHPAAVASSRRRLGWRFDFGHLLRQGRLMDLLPSLHRSGLEVLNADSSRDILDESAMLWKLVYWFVQEQLRAQEHHIVVRHEDLCRHPLGRFESLFQSLGLSFDRTASHAVRKHSSSVRSEPPSRTDVRRDSAASVGKWREELSTSEIARVRDRVGDVANLFYPGDEW